MATNVNVRHLLKETVETEDKLETTAEQFDCLTKFRSWVETEAEFYGRTDDAFLLLFLRGCKFDLEKTKKKLAIYYVNRRKIPQWWANRDIRAYNIWSLVQLGTNIALIDQDPTKPSIVMTILARYGPNLGNFDDYGKLISIIVEVYMRRRSCQLNGIVWIVDCRNYPMWLTARMIWPTVAKNLAIPVRPKGVIVLNCPAIGVAFFNVAKSFLPQKFKQRVQLCGSDWSKIYDYVDVNCLPEEYGGNAGPIKLHDEAFMKEVLSLADYIVEDNKYGLKR